ncbi:MAG: hypothetical protein EPN98_18420 [Phenylobacterium sp.]|uniref:hypothetical protein n=1 Tax=Phenylobacterium sp. TaxID=1871053 RepID=UPI001225906B|nr:hypothetical protein [Phenylobacterium sp.]TAL30090.1 MAG: hypothetical protein EPN98_18420 [Phenylobacterium sp.]
MPRLELEDTYLTLDGKGGLNSHAVEGFWETVDSGERRVGMVPGATCIVPKGVWRRALVPQPSRFIVITYGPGTTHRLV